MKLVFAGDKGSEGLGRCALFERNKVRERVILSHTNHFDNFFNDFFGPGFQDILSGVSSSSDPKPKN